MYHIGGNKSLRIFWRSVAIISTFIWSIVFFASHAFPAPDMTLSAVPLFIRNTLPLISIIASIVLIIFPMQFYIYGAMCCLWGLSILIDSASTSAVLMYLLGCAFTYYKLFFSKREPKHEPIKCAILLVPLVIVIAFQYRLGTSELLTSIFDILLLSIFFILMYFLVIVPFFVQKNKKNSEQTESIDLSGLTADEILRLKEIIANTAFNTIEQDTEKCSDTVGELNLSVLTEEEILILTSVLENKTLQEIAGDRKIGLSVIKKQVPSIYRKLGVNRKHIFQLHRTKKLIFSK